MAAESTVDAALHERRLRAVSANLAELQRRMPEKLGR